MCLVAPCESVKHQRLIIMQDKLGKESSVETSDRAIGIINFTFARENLRFGVPYIRQCKLYTVDVVKFGSLLDG